MCFGVRMQEDFLVRPELCNALDARDYTIRFVRGTRSELQNRTGVEVQEWVPGEDRNPRSVCSQYLQWLGLDPNVRKSKDLVEMRGVEPNQLWFFQSGSYVKVPDFPNPEEWAEDQRERGLPEEAITGEAYLNDMARLANKVIPQIRLLSLSEFVSRSDLSDEEIFKGYLAYLRSTILYAKHNQDTHTDESLCVSLSMNYFPKRVLLEKEQWQDQALVDRVFRRNAAQANMEMNPMLTTLGQNCQGIAALAINFDNPDEPDDSVGTATNQHRFEIQTRDWTELDRVLSITRVLVFNQFHWCINPNARDLLNRLMGKNPHLVVIIKQMYFNDRRWHPDDMCRRPFEYGDRVRVDLAIAPDTVDVRKIFGNVTEIQPLHEGGKVWSVRDKAYTMYASPFRV